MLNFANKTLKYGLEMDTWYTEMLSMLTEDFFNEQLEIDFKNSVRARLLTFIKGGYIIGFKNWINADSASSEEDQLKCSCNYANAYAFGAYLARNYGGADLFHEIATNEYTNEESVLKAVNILNGTNYTFEDLLKDFCLILVNPTAESTGATSLYLKTEENIDSYTFILPEINLKQLPNNPFDPNDYTFAEITPITPKSTYSKYLGGYGFHYYEFEEQKDLKITYKDFLLCEYF